MVVPPKHPKMIIFSRKTNSCWVHKSISLERKQLPTQTTPRSGTSLLPSRASLAISSSSLLEFVLKKTSLLVADIEIQQRMFLNIYHQKFQVPKMQGLNLIRLFWGWVFPYISRIHTAYIGEDTSILGA